MSRSRPSHGDRRGGASLRVKAEKAKLVSYRPLSSFVGRPLVRSGTLYTVTVATAWILGLESIERTSLRTFAIDDDGPLRETASNPVSLCHPVWGEAGRHSCFLLAGTRRWRTG